MPIKTTLDSPKLQQNFILIIRLFSVIAGHSLVGYYISAEMHPCILQPLKTWEEVPDELCHSLSVDLPKATWAQRGLINRLPGNVCGCHGVKAIIKKRYQHTNTFDAGTGNQLKRYYYVALLRQPEGNLWIQTICDPLKKLTLCYFLPLAKGLGKYILSRKWFLRWA